MDFRSQLSAFSNKSGGGGGNDRPPQRSPNNNNNNNNNTYYGRGGGGGGYHNNNNNNNDRRGPRPRTWSDPRGPPQQRRRQHSPDRDGLGDLRDHGYRIARGPPPLPPADYPKNTKHLCLLVITIEDLPFEHIWKAWTQTTTQEDLWISIVVHAKFPQKLTSSWLKQRLLVCPPKVGRGNSFLDPEYLTRKPNWGSIDITRAMLDLLHDGLRIGKCTQGDMRFSANRYLVKRPPMALDNATEDIIPPVDQFLFVSETCLPITTAQVMFDTVTDTTKSWVNARHRNDEGIPKNKYEGDQFAGIHRRLPGQYRWKADQWVLLCRHHAALIMDMDRPHISPKYQLWQSFRDINASDEMYFPTCLGLLGLLRYNGQDAKYDRTVPQQHQPHDPSKPEYPSKDKQQNKEEPKVETVLNRPVTYTDWTEGMRNPASFTKGVEDFKRVARLARAKGCLLARKFAPFVAVPGVPLEEQKITGQITAEEWTAAIEAMQGKEPEEKPVEEKAEESDSGEEEPEEEGQASEEQQEASDAEDGEEGEENAEEDDDNDETQLE
jgi:hypothetical protein